MLWDGKNNKGRQVSSGIYFYRIKVIKYSKTGKMTLVTMTDEIHLQDESHLTGVC